MYYKISIVTTPWYIQHMPFKQSLITQTNENIIVSDINYLYL